MKKIIFAFALLLFAVSFTNAQYGYRWVVKPSGTMSNLYSAYFGNSNTGFICGSNGTVLVSTNGYNTWTSKSPGINVNLYSMTSASLGYNSIICTGENGTVLYTSNAGNNWSQLNSGTTSKLNYVMRNGTQIFAVGDGGIIITSIWNGTAYPPFTQIPSGTTQNLKSFFWDGYQNAYICGNNGTLLKSTNSGISWSPVAIPTSQNLNSVIGNNTEILLCGDNGLIIRTSNGGQNWINDPSGVSSNLNYLQYYNYLFGSAGTVLYNQYTSVWGQYNWKRISVPTTSDLNYAVSYNDFYAFGSNGTILKQEIDSALMNIKIDANNISTYLNYRGVFDRYWVSNNSPGFEWTRNSNKYLVFTTGLSASCLINGQLAQTMCSYMGEYYPGAITNGQHNDSSIFRIYKVSRTDSPSSTDWMNWGCMVPYGAPYTDVNNNGIYEPLIDTPGVKNAAQTIFACLTDINPGSHNVGEGFGGGVTSPLMGIELHVTKWAYTYQSMSDVMFTKFEIVNKGGNIWSRTRFAFVSDPDVGSPDDDHAGCDTVRNMGYAYNGNNNDPIYGTAPPAVGFDVLKGPVNKRVSPNVTYNMSSFIRFINCNANPPNECEPNGEPYPAYYMMQGFKKDSAAWLDRTQPTTWGSYKRSKKIFYGDPETNAGWTASKGYVVNYMNDSVGYQSPEIIRDMRFVLGMGADNYTMLNGDTAVIWLAQIAARGTNNLNSVTKLKQLSDVVQTFFDNNFTIGVNRISSEVPADFSLGQNYPNPFNPVTKIRYAIARAGDVKLIVYDALGRKVSELVNEKQSPGTYEVLFDALSVKSGTLASGVYFYRLTAGDFSQTKKLLLIK